MAIIADGLENPDWSGVALALIRQLARTGAGEGGGDQAGRLPSAPAGARSRSTTSSSAPRATRTSTSTAWWLTRALVMVLRAAPSPVHARNPRRFMALGTARPGPARNGVGTRPADSSSADNHQPASLLLPPSRLVPARPSHASSATSSGGFGRGKTRGGPMRPRRRQSVDLPAFQCATAAHPHPPTGPGPPGSDQGNVDGFAVY